MSKEQLQVIDQTLFKLNTDGTNEFTLQVQPGFDDNGVRLSEDKIKQIATIIAESCKDIDFNAIVNS